MKPSASILLVLAGAVVAGVSDAFKEWVKALVGDFSFVFWPVLGFLVCGLAWKMLRVEPSYDSVKPPDPKAPRYPGWRRHALGACCVIGILVTVLGLSTPKHRLEVNCDPCEIAVGSSSHLGLLLDEQALPAGYFASWKLDPSTPQSTLQENTYVPGRDLFLSSRRAQKVRVSATVRRGNWEVGTASTEVTVRYAPLVTIYVSPSPAYVGSPVTLSVLVDGSMETKYKYVWTVGAKTLPSDRPEAMLPHGVSESEVTSGDSPRVAVKVVAFDGEARVAAGITSLPLKYRRQWLTGYVLDASQRMAIEDPPGVSPLSGAIDDIELAASLLASVGGQLGFWCVGDAESMPDPCARVRTVIPLGRIGPDTGARIRSVTQGRDDQAPVTLGVRAALAALSRRPRRPDAMVDLVVITGGPDTCNQDDVASYVEALKRLLGSGTIIELRQPVMTWMVGVALRSEDQDAWQQVIGSPDYWQMEDRVLLIADSPAILRRILHAIRRLASQSVDDRLRACDELIELADRQRDKATIDRLQEYRKRLPG